MNRILCAIPCTWDGRGGLPLIGHLSTFIMTAKDWVYRHEAARLLWYALVIALLLEFWLFVPQAEINFVYNAF